MRDHQQLVALDPLQVRAEPEVLAQPPELQRPLALNEVLSGLQLEVVIPDVGWIAWGTQTSTPPSALMTLMNPVKFSWTKSSIWMFVCVLERVPQAAGPAVGERRVELLDLTGRRLLARAVALSALHARTGTTVSRGKLIT